jgi:tetratricopeptide (TPR) repeat protein
MLVLAVMGCSKKPPEVKAYERGIQQMSERKFVEALSSFNEAIHLNSSFASAYVARGIGEMVLRDNSQQAILNFTKAIELNPQYAEAYTNRGAVFTNLGQFDTALADQNRALELNPNYANAYNNRALLYLRTTEYDKAWEDVHQAEKLGVPVEPRIIEELNKAKENKAKP